MGKLAQALGKTPTSLARFWTNSKVGSLGNPVVGGKPYTPIPQRLPMSDIESARPNCFVDIINDMKRKSLRRMLGLLILLVSLALLIWAFWPMEQTNLTIPIPLENMRMPTPAGLLFAGWSLL
jgi:hypothetical protein